MGSSQEIYVRTEGFSPERLAEALRECGSMDLRTKLEFRAQKRAGNWRVAAEPGEPGPPEADPSKPFTRVPWLLHEGSDEKGWPAEVALRNLSTVLRTDTIWLAYSSNSNYLEYARWSSGACLRTLAFGEGEWRVVSGAPEEWEAVVLGPVAVGVTEENRCALETARAIAEHFRFPGWE